MEKRISLRICCVKDFEPDLKANPRLKFTHSLIFDR